MDLAALLVAGGTGTRLYPASRPDHPKQFLTLGGDRTLLRRAADRAAFADELFAVAPERYADRVREEVPEATVLVEPDAKDTGPALVYGAARIGELADGDPVICCLPTDQHVGDGFEATVRRAARAAAGTGGLVTVGVEPDRPATGYGYVEPGGEVDGYAPVKRFREKPDAETARELVAAGCLWNTGVFAWTPDALLREAADSPLAPLVDALRDGRPAEAFAAVDAVSVDHAILERTDEAYVVPAGFEWEDLGTWAALDRLSGDANAVLGDALCLDAEGNVVASDDKHVSVVGVDDLVVAAFGDRVLVVPKAEAERVRDVVDALDE